MATQEDAMRKFLMGIVLLVLTLTVGCGGTWCSGDRMYCIEGFSGFKRYSDFNGQYYYPYSVLTIENAGSKKQCSLEVIVDGVRLAAGIERGQYRRIEIKIPPRENRQATVLIRRICGSEFSGSYAGVIQVSSTQSATYAWVMDDTQFKKKRW